MVLYTILYSTVGLTMFLYSSCIIFESPPEAKEEQDRKDGELRQAGSSHRSFRKSRVPYFGALITRILLFRVLGVPYFGNSPMEPKRVFFLVSMAFIPLFCDSSQRLPKTPLSREHSLNLGILLWLKVYSLVKGYWLGWVFRGLEG